MMLAAKETELVILKGALIKIHLFWSYEGHDSSYWEVEDSGKELILPGVPGSQSVKIFSIAGQMVILWPRVLDWMDQNLALSSIWWFSLMRMWAWEVVKRKSNKGWRDLPKTPLFSNHVSSWGRFSCFLLSVEWSANSKGKSGDCGSLFSKLDYEIRNWMTKAPSHLWGIIASGNGKNVLALESCRRAITNHALN